MSKFNVGDQVRVAANPHDENYVATILGCEGVITDTGSFGWIVTIGTEDFALEEEELEFVARTSPHDIAWYEAELDKKDAEIQRLTDILNWVSGDCEDAVKKHGHAALERMGNTL